MIKLWAIVLALLLTGVVYAQERKYSPYYYQRVSLFEVLPTSDTDILFVGNSISDGSEWAELLEDCRCKNRGISGDTTEGVYDRLCVITKGKPAKIFLMIGINDLGRGGSAEEVLGGIKKIILKIQADSPSTKIYLQSILPVNNTTGQFAAHTSRWADIKPLNYRLEALSNEVGVIYVDLYHHFVSPDTELLDLRYSNDGLHLMGLGYAKWIQLIKPYID